MSETETTPSEVAAIDCAVCGETMDQPAIWLSYHPYDDPVHLCSVQCHVEQIWRDVR